jgi:hypothetical protein
VGGSRAFPFLLKSDPNLWWDKGDTHGPRTCFTFPFHQLSEKSLPVSVIVSDHPCNICKVDGFLFGLIFNA